MNRLADLHVHTIYSNDAFVPPDRLLPAAKQRGVVAMALTEHDNIDSWPVISALANGSGVEVIPGVEIDTDSDELGHRHVLAYLFDPSNARLREILDAEVACGRQQMLDGIVRLRQLGHDVDLDRVRSYWHSIYPGRALGKKMVWLWMARQGRFPDDDAAKQYYQQNVAPAVSINHRCPHQQTVIQAIHQARGLAVLAHPGDTPEPQIRTLVSWGIDGLEVFTPHNKGHNQRLAEIAARLDLLTTGGGDYHGLLESIGDDWPGGAPVECYHALRRRHRELFG
jgi:predicted metal-dependent phosphoesterase TrpH